MAESLEDLEQMLGDLNGVSQQVGLKMNMDKTKVMYNVHVAPTTVFYSVAALLDFLLMGMSMGYLALLMPALVRGDGLQADIDQAAWISSTPGLSGIISAIAIGPLTHCYGRRIPLIGSNFLVLLGWLLIYLAESLWILALGTALQGLGVGLVSFYSIIMAEFTCPRIRGMVLLLKLTCSSIGVFIIHGLGYFMHWRNAALIPLVPVAISMVISFLSPDTPDWLVSKNRCDEAETIFYQLRGRSRESERQIREVIDAQKMKLGRATVETENWGGFFRKLRSKALWRPLALLLFCLLIPEAGGRHFIPSYSLQMAEDITGDKSSGYFYTICLDLISIFCALTSCFLTKRFNRRLMLVKSGYIASVVYLMSCLLLYIKSSYESKGAMYASIVFLAMYVVIVYTTLFGTCYAILGELLPLEFRAIGLVLNGLMGGASNWLFIKTLPILQRWFGLHGMLATFCGIMLVLLFYMDYELPETKDRTLHDIGAYFRGKSPKIRRESETFSDEEVVAMNCAEKS